MTNPQAKTAATGLRLFRGGGGGGQTGEEEAQASNERN